MGYREDLGDTAVAVYNQDWSTFDQIAEAIAAKVLRDLIDYLCLDEDKPLRKDVRRFAWKKGISLAEHKEHIAEHIPGTEPSATNMHEAGI